MNLVRMSLTALVVLAALALSTRSHAEAHCPPTGATVDVVANGVSTYIGGSDVSVAATYDNGAKDTRYITRVYVHGASSQPPTKSLKVKEGMPFECGGERFSLTLIDGEVHANGKNYELLTTLYSVSKVQ
jgi:hypothetical protein